MKVVPSCLVVVLLLTSSGSAQSPPETQHTAKIRAAVQKAGAGAHVRVTLRDSSSEVKGFISRIHDDGFDVTRAKTGEVLAVPYSNVETLRGPGMSKSMKIALGVTVAALVVVAIVVAVAVSNFKV